MRTLSIFALLLTLGTLPARPPADEVDPKSLVERAIEAHGGREKLVQVRADQVKTKGTLFLGDKEAPFVAETWVQLPGQFKNAIEVTTSKTTKIRLMQIVSKDRITETLDGLPHKSSPAALSEIRETLHLNNIVRLVPMLASPDIYRLDYTGELKIQERTLQGIKVSTRGRQEVRLFFDKANGMLVRTEQQLDDGNGKEIRQEGYYLDFRDLGGYKRPIKMAAYRDGKKVMEAELLDVKYFEKFDETIFTP